ncbi:hypothetical protein QUB47_22320 [Microcoleus sp. AT9_B5]
MDTQKLVAAIDAEIEKEGRLPDEKIFLKLLKEVWQVDWTVAPYDVWTHMIEWDIPYFLRFMGMDQGDEGAEDQLIQDWIASRAQLRATTTGSDSRQRIITLINDANRLRVSVRQDV